MFWTLKTCLQDLYDKATHRAWVVLFSSILSVVVPVAVMNEVSLNEKSAVVNRRTDNAHSFSWKSTSFSLRDLSKFASFEHIELDENI